MDLAFAPQASDEAPVVSLRRSRGMSPADCSALLEAVRCRAEAMLGTDMVYELAQTAVDCLSHVELQDHDSQSFHSQMAARLALQQQHSQEMAEQMYQREQALRQLLAGDRSPGAADGEGVGEWVAWAEPHIRPVLLGATITDAHQDGPRAVLAYVGTAAKEPRLLTVKRYRTALSSQAAGTDVQLRRRLNRLHAIEEKAAAAAQLQHAAWCPSRE